MTARLEARVAGGVGGFVVEATFATGDGPLVVIGPNGAGKSTLLGLLLGVVPLARGRVVVGSDVLEDTQAQMAVPLEARRLGYVPQHGALFPHLPVRGQLDFAVRVASPSLARSERAARVDEVARELSLDALADRLPATLSGGERQRVALARALVARPRALLLDEPLASLDVHHRADVRRLLARELARRALPAVIVTHDPADVRALADRVVVLEQGRVVQTGAWSELVAAPATPFVAAFVADAPA